MMTGANSTFENLANFVKIKQLCIEEESADSKVRLALHDEYLTKVLLESNFIKTVITPWSRDQEQSHL